MVLKHYRQALTLSYTWSFTDGTLKTLTGQTATYAFTTPGIYTVTLTVQDSNGSGADTVTITVQSSTPPVAKIKIEGLASGESATVGQSLIFNGSESYESNGGAIKKYLWDMGDDTIATTSMNPIKTYSFPPSAIDRTYNVTLTVFDATDINSTATTSIKVLKGGVGSVVDQDTPSSTPEPTQTSTSDTTPTPDAATVSDTTPTPNAGADTQDFSIPPTILAIIVVFTVIVLGGSTVWLRKRV